VLILPPSVRIFVCVGATDMRKSFDGLSAAARNILDEDPLSGHLFAFSNRARDRVKLLYWERSGFWVFAKRLERGTFSWPKIVEGRRKVEMRWEDLALMLGGIDVKHARRRRWFDVSPRAEEARNFFRRPT
jgi:transposase